jgi:ATP-dependent Lhr-like helicase
MTRRCPTPLCGSWCGPGRVTGDTFAPAAGPARRGAHGPHRTRPSRVRGARGMPRAAALSAAPGGSVGRCGHVGRPGRSGPARVVRAVVVGLLPPVRPRPDAAGIRQRRAAARPLRRAHPGRGRVAEDVPGGFAGVYRVLAGRRRPVGCAGATSSRGSGASQFGTTGAVDRLRSGTGGVGATRGPPCPPHPRRSSSRRATRRTPTVPRCPGRARARPGRCQREGRPRRRHQPGRKAGAVVVLVDGELVLYVERGWQDPAHLERGPDLLRAAADALADAVREGSARTHHRREGRRRVSCWARTTPSSRPSSRPAST